MAHAFLAPSSFSRTIKCPASAIRAMQVEARIELIAGMGAEFYGLATGEETERFEINMTPDQSAASDGTARHDIFEGAINNVLTEYRDILPLVEGHSDLSDAAKRDKYINDQLIACIQRQLEFLEDAEWVSVEHKVKVNGLPQFGHVDLAAHKNRTLYIKDLKTGRVEVSAEDNDQLRPYAVGICDELGWDKFDSVEVEILGLHFPDSTWVIPIDELREYKDNVMHPTFMEAYKINPRAEAGEHCLYCPAKLHCREWQEEFNGVANEYFDLDAAGLEELDNDELLKIRSTLKVGKNALDIVNRILMERVQGFNPPKVTLVKGKKITKWVDEEAVKKKFKKEAFKQVLREPKEFAAEEVADLTKITYGRGWIR